MEHWLIELARGSGGFLHLSISLIIVGITLIIINITTHALIESYRSRSDRRALVIRSLRPVENAAADLVSRLSEMLVTHQVPMQRTIAAYDPAMSLTERLPVLNPISMNRHESTAFRLVRFLALAEEFRRDTADIASFQLIEEAEYFLDHKIPVGLKGNLYEGPLLSTELQQELGSTLLLASNERRTDVGHLCECLHRDEYSRLLFQSALGVFRFDVTPLADDGTIRIDDQNWRRILTLSHLGIYLIDFFHRFADNSQWEEQRLFFVRLIRMWNTIASKARYLYEPGDLTTNSYIDTFPGQLTPSGLGRNLLGKLADLLHVRRLIERRRKWIYLNLRGARFRRRHDTKRIRKWGVAIRTRDGWRSVRWTDDLYTVLRSVRDVLKVRSSLI